MTQTFDREVEDLFHVLWVKINEAEQPTASFPSVCSSQIFNTKTGELDGASITGKPQFARCIYCNKQIAAWGKLKVGKKQRWGYRLPDVLTNASIKHTIPCAEDWAWRTLSRWSIGACRSDGESFAIEKWRHGLEKEAKDGRAWGLQPKRFTLAMFDRLPTNDPNVIQAIELGLVTGLQYSLRDWITSNSPIPKHGESDANPHMLFPCKFGNAQYGIWGICPCGALDWRGHDWRGVEEPMILTVRGDILMLDAKTIGEIQNASLVDRNGRRIFTPSALGKVDLP